MNLLCTDPAMSFVVLGFAGFGGGEEVGIVWPAHEAQPDHGPPPVEVVECAVGSEDCESHPVDIGTRGEYDRCSIVLSVQQPQSGGSVCADFDVRRCPDDLPCALRVEGRSDGNHVTVECEVSETFSQTLPRICHGRGVDPVRSLCLGCRRRIPVDVDRKE